MLLRSGLWRKSQRPSKSSKMSSSVPVANSSRSHPAVPLQTFICQPLVAPRPVCRYNYSTTTTSGTTGSGSREPPLPPSGSGGNGRDEPPVLGRGRNKRRLSSYWKLHQYYSLQQQPHLSDASTSSGYGKSSKNHHSQAGAPSDKLLDFNALLRVLDASATAKRNGTSKAAKGVPLNPISPFEMLPGGSPDGSGKNPANSNNTNNNSYFDFYQHFVASSTAAGAAHKKKSASKEEISLDQAVTLQEYTDTLETMIRTMNPRTIRQHLDDYVIGQSKAKESLSCAVYNHYTRVFHNLQKRRDAMLSGEFPSAKPKHLLDKSNILLLGPSGSGKTLMAKRIAEILKVPFSTNDATTFTQAGYVGDDVDQCITRLLQNAGSDVKKTEIGIVFIDEIDKISKRIDTGMHSSSRDVAGEGVQQALLKMLEGTVVHVPEKGSKKGESVAVDTSNILFILSGAFVGMERVLLERNKGERSMGFGAKVSAALQETPTTHQSLEETTEADLIRYGLIPEFVGRIPLIVALNRLSEEELVRILKEPKNSLLEQYRNLFATWDVELKFTDEALHAIARRVMDRHTGARGLKFVMEEILKEPMYAAPGSDITAITIDESLTAQFTKQ